MAENNTRRPEKLPTMRALKAWIFLHLQRYDEALETLGECNEESE